MQLVSFERAGRVERTLAEPVPASGSLEGAWLGFEAMEAGRPGVHRLGAQESAGPCRHHIIDLNRALAMKLALEDVGAPEAEADSLLPPHPLAFLRRGDEAMDAARAALCFVREVFDRYDPPDLARAGVLEPVKGVRIGSPVPRPGKILGVARNYPSHAAESGQRDAPQEPVLFLKSTSAVIGPGDDIVLPRVSSQVDYEGELAVVIGRPTREVGEAQALSAVAGYTVANDVTARDYQNTRGQHFIGKSLDTFAPLGPALITRDELGDVQNLGIRTILSGETVQSASTKEMTFSVAHLVAFASRLMTLEPGDVILTGTPAGVGRSQDPPRWLREGDVVEVQVEGIGTLRNHVVRQRGRG